MEHNDFVVQSDYREERNIIWNHVKPQQPASSDLPEWRTYPEIPTAQDLNPDWNNPKDKDRIDSLLPNNWDRPFPDKNTYLETHYRLQREEAISLLRYSVKKYREDPTMKDDDDTCIYTRVFVQGYLMTRMGPMCRVQFSTARAEKRIRWTQTRRLTTGSLVALSTAQDGFRTICMPAIIADRPIRDGLDASPPNIQLLWADTGRDAIIDPTTELVMLETRSGYFESVRHCMVGLQHVAASPTPLDKYLVSLDESDLVAENVLANPEMNLGCLVHHLPDSSTLSVDEIRTRLMEERDSLRHYPILDGIDDRISPYTNLDNSQLGAVHRILTRQLGIIQGPPGTGKTFTSVQGLQIMLNSQKQRGRDVIIVAAQTNHAVDQILIQLINLGYQAVRLGGRTQNEDIKRYSMYNLRNRVIPPRMQAANKDYRSLEAARRKNITRVEELIASAFSSDLLDPQALQAAGIITQKQLESLLADDGWIHSATDEGSSSRISQWLGDQCVKATSIDIKDPDFDAEETDDEVDLDVEDYNMDLDDRIGDDDDDCSRIDGRWVPIKYQWTGANPRRYTETDIVIRKEIKRENLWNISTGYRGAVYQYWQRELVRLRRVELCDELVSYDRICKDLKANKWQKDLRCIKMAQIEIIGCTTTGLCKYRGLLAGLKPRTILIEEAAETKEANIISALYPSLQQLILVGDHQQLAPSCDTPFLDQNPYYLRVSMFERLVKLNMPYTMLNMQRRMNPVIREILSPFYPLLRDHPVVCEPDARPPVPGMAQQSFFFDHTWSEATDENLSKYNSSEAEMIVHFIEYLMMNGVKDTEITVLTFYRGQRKKILGEFRKLTHRAPFKNVQTVDSYQGEENDIVILSLVRSNGPNGPHNAGFLRDSNRGVVAISRARRGFYIFGNMTNLIYSCDESRSMWGPVYETFRRQNRFGHEALPITCQKHGKTEWIRSLDDWVDHHGGCTEACDGNLECGHACGRRCHWIAHDLLICMKPCESVLNCEHPCQRLCGEDCRCDCAKFTGAYSNDETWDDNRVLQPIDQKLVPSRLPVAPYIDSDGRHGRLRGSEHRRGKQVQAPGSSIKPTAAAENWANFNARRHDAERRQKSISSASKNVIKMTNMIQETFRPVALSTEGRRNVREGKSKPSSPETAVVTGEPSHAMDQDQDFGSPRGLSAEKRAFEELAREFDSLMTHKFIPIPSDRRSKYTVEANHKSAQDNVSELDIFNGVNERSQRLPPDISAHQRGIAYHTDEIGSAADRPEWEYSSTVDEGPDSEPTPHQEDNVEVELLIEF